MPADTLRDARTRYFRDNHFGDDGGYAARWVDLKLGPLPIRFPNTASRVRAVRYHDLHHIVTGYRTDVLGECEIAAWEIGAGCKGFTAAWFLNFTGMAGGVWRYPGRTFRAFVRGRRTRSLYGRELEPLLERGVDDVRRELRLDEAAPRPTAADIALFAAAVLAGQVCGALFLVVGLVLGPAAALASLAKRD